MDKKVLISFTSTYNPNWHQTIADLKKFSVKEFALFVTTIGTADERWQILREIKAEVPQVKIPFAHIRPDMSPAELDFLIDNFGTQAFNLHPTKEYPLEHDYSNYLDKIWIENGGPTIHDGLEVSDIDGFAGICLDLSHLEGGRLQNFPGYGITTDTLKRFKIGANHISAISTEPVVYGGKPHRFDIHQFSDLSQFDYLKNFPAEYFGQFIALELINPVSEQLEAKKYIESIITKE